MDNGASSYRRYLDGDDNALGEIIEMYHDGISLYINNIVHNICIAEEIMQITFYRIAIKNHGIPLNTPLRHGFSQ